MKLHTRQAAVVAGALSVLLAAGCGEGPINDNEGTPPGITEGPGEDVGVEEEEAGS